MRLAMTDPTARMARLGSRDGARRVLVPALFLVIALVLAFASIGSSALLSSRWAFGLLVTAVGVGLCLVNIRIAIIAVVAYSIIAGFMRRVTAADGSSIDAMLLVLPIATVVLGAIAVHRGAARDRTVLGNLVVVLLILAVLGALNPIQGSLAVGIVGIAFFGVPMIWFFVGRHLITDRDFAAVLRVASLIAIPVAIYGLFQSRGFFFSGDQRWVESNEKGLILGGSIRPFGTMASTGEYARFSMIAALLWITYAAQRQRAASLGRLLAIAAAGLLTWATVLTGVRVSLLTATFAIGVVLAARAKLSPRSSLLVVALMIAFVVGLAQLLQGIGTSNFIVDRQISGIADPFSSENITVARRADLIVRTVEQVPSHPIGSGTGATTPAASRFGDRDLTTETDIGDVTLSWGIPGLVAYVAFIVFSGSRAYRVAQHRGDWVSTAALAILCVAITQWINGGLYAVAPLAWLSLGWIDRAFVQERAAERKAKETKMEMAMARS